MSQRRKIQRPGPSVQGVVEGALLDFAQHRFDEEMREFNAQIGKTEGALFDQLSSPAFAESLGLPADLPEETRHILKRTMALDRHGPDMPRRNRTYGRYGIGGG